MHYRLTKEELTDLLNKVYETGCYGFLDLRDSEVEKHIEECEKYLEPPNLKLVGVDPAMEENVVTLDRIPDSMLEDMGRARAGYHEYLMSQETIQPPTADSLIVGHGDEVHHITISAMDDNLPNLNGDVITMTSPQGHVVSFNTARIPQNNRSQKSREIWV